MANLISWIKNNKLAVFLVVVIVVLFGRSLTQSFVGFTVNQRMAPLQTFSEDMAVGMEAPAAGMARSKSIIPPYPIQEDTPRADVTDRLVVQESNLSLVVNNVRQSVNQIIDHASQTGGYMVSSSLNQPEEAPYATVVVRVPATQLNQVLEYYRSLAIKVSSENLRGRDVTDQYLDIETRLSRLRRTQAKFEELLEQAVEFEDILRAQREVLNLQDQIDRYIGQQQYLEQTAKLAKLTIHLSTDELALPYTPSETFRPSVVFKLAVRALLRTFQNLAGKAIWVAVYSAIWLPAILLFIVARRWWHKRQKPPTS
jgi:hypothetical protein